MTGLVKIAFSETSLPGMYVTVNSMAITHFFLYVGQAGTGKEDRTRDERRQGGGLGQEGTGWGQGDGKTGGKEDGLLHLCLWHAAQGHLPSSTPTPFRQTSPPAFSPAPASISPSGGRRQASLLFYLSTYPTPALPCCVSLPMQLPTCVSHYTTDFYPSPSLLPATCLRAPLRPRREERRHPHRRPAFHHH